MRRERASGTGVRRAEPTVITRASAYDSEWMLALVCLILSMDSMTAQCQTSRTASAASGTKRMGALAHQPFSPDCRQSRLPTEQPLGAQRRRSPRPSGSDHASASVNADPVPSRGVCWTHPGAGSIVVRHQACKLGLGIVELRI